MNQPPVDPGSALERSSFEKSCVYCGARLHVALSRQRGSDEEHDFACPECGKEYTTRAAVEPVVSVLAPRSDGKNDRYQETMF